MVKDKSIQFRKGKDLAFKGLIIFLTSVTTLPLLLVLYYIFKKGISAINWDFLVNLPKPVGEVGGGIYNAIIGSGLIILVACVIAVPFGVAIGVYLSEFKTYLLCRACSGCSTGRSINCHWNRNLYLGSETYGWISCFIRKHCIILNNAPDNCKIS